GGLLRATRTTELRPLTRRLIRQAKRGQQLLHQVSRGVRIFQQSGVVRLVKPSGEVVTPILRPARLLQLHQLNRVQVMAAVNRLPQAPTTGTKARRALRHRTHSPPASRQHRTAASIAPSGGEKELDGYACTLADIAAQV